MKLGDIEAKLETRMKWSERYLMLAFALYRKVFGKQYNPGESETTAPELRMCFDLVMRKD